MAKSIFFGASAVVSVVFALVSCSKQQETQERSDPQEIEATGAYQLGVTTPGIIKMPAGGKPVQVGVSVNGGALVQSPFLPKGFGAKLSSDFKGIKFTGVNSGKDVEYIKIDDGTGGFLMSVNAGMPAAVTEITLKADIYPFSSAVVRKWIQILGSPTISGPIATLTTHLDNSVSTPTTFKVVGDTPEAVNPPLTTANFGISAIGGDIGLFDKNAKYVVTCVADPADTAKKTLNCTLTLTPNISGVFGKKMATVDLQLTVVDNLGAGSKPANFSLISTNNPPNFKGISDPVRVIAGRYPSDKFDQDLGIIFDVAKNATDVDGDSIPLITYSVADSNLHFAYIFGEDPNRTARLWRNKGATIDTTVITKPQATVFIRDRGGLSAETTLNLNFTPYALGTDLVSNDFTLPNRPSGVFKMNVGDVKHVIANVFDMNGFSDLTNAGIRINGSSTAKTTITIENIDLTNLKVNGTVQFDIRAVKASVAQEFARVEIEPFDGLAGISNSYPYVNTTDIWVY